MTDPTPQPAPDPIGDVVPGDPPVPITVWHVPRPEPGATLSAPLAQRLVANFTHPRDLILDLTTGDHLRDAATTARRRHHRQAADDGAPERGAASWRARLIVSGWPLGSTGADEHMAACARNLRTRGCLIVVISLTEPADHLAALVGAARTARLTYLQHIVAAHHLKPHHGTGRLGRDGRHLRVHTDVLAFGRPGAGAAGV